MRSQPLYRVGYRARERCSADLQISKYSGSTTAYIAKDLRSTCKNVLSRSLPRAAIDLKAPHEQVMVFQSSSPYAECLDSVSRDEICDQECIIGIAAREIMMRQ